MSSKVEYKCEGFADRLIASTVERAAIKKASDQMERWWAIAQEELAKQRLLPSPVSGGQGVQRILSFAELEEDEEFEEGRSRRFEDEEEDDEWDEKMEWKFEDAVSHLDSPTLRGTQGMLELLSVEALQLQEHKEAVLRRRETLEARVVKLQPSNPLVVLAQWVNGDQRLWWPSEKKSSWTETLQISKVLRARPWGWGLLLGSSWVLLGVLLTLFLKRRRR
jgi:hypothetical protein